jgi:hypothetical protein
MKKGGIPFPFLGEFFPLRHSAELRLSFPHWLLLSYYFALCLLPNSSLSPPKPNSSKPSLPSSNFACAALGSPHFPKFPFSFTFAVLFGLIAQFREVGYKQRQQPQLGNLQQTDRGKRKLGNI